MAAPIETPGGPRGPGLRPDPREIRIRFESRNSLLAGFALAQGEPWMEDCRVDLPRRELVVRMAGGFGHPPPGRRRLAGPGRLRLVAGAPRA